jgi:hypothetical protein
MAIEQDDPCERAKQLKVIRDKLITGQGVAEYEFEAGNGQRRRVKYSAASLDQLNREIAAAENACAISQGKRPRRFAIVPR